MGYPQENQKIIDQNKRAWNQVASRHAAQNFEQTRHNLHSKASYYVDSEFRDCLQRIGIADRVLAQFNCNNGRELISALQLGYAQGYGYDFSAEFVQQARQLASEAEVPAEFVETDIYGIPDRYKKTADILFLTAGALCWMPDLNSYFRAAREILRPGGSLVLYETHPFLEMFKTDREREKGEQLSLTYPYFMEEPVAWGAGLDYYSGESYGQEVVYWYHHTISEIIQAVLDNNFAIAEFSEYGHDNSIGYREVENFPVRPPMSFILHGRRAEEGKVS